VAFGTSQAHQIGRSDLPLLPGVRDSRRERPIDFGFLARGNRWLGYPTGTKPTPFPGPRVDRRNRLGVGALLVGPEFDLM